MIARVKRDLRTLFNYTDHTNFNKFWRKALGGSNTWSYRDYYNQIFHGLTEVKICQDTINELKKIKTSDNIFIYIYKCKDYTKDEMNSILENNVDDVDWYGIYHKCDMDFEHKVKYYKGLRATYIKKYIGTEENADVEFKEVEREHKIRLLLKEA